jgi:putative inorganic carbon (HCO3(-)) transporter
LADLEGVWLLLLLPVVLLITPARFLLLLLLPFAWLLRKIGTGHFEPVTPLNGAVLLLLAMALVSVAATFDLAFSLQKIAGLLFGVAVFFAVAAFAGQSPARLWIVVAAFLGVGAAIAGASLLAMRWSSSKIPFLTPLRELLPQRGPVAGLAGVIGPNEVAGTLLWLLPLAISLTIAFAANVLRRRWQRLLPFLLAAGASLAMGLTFLVTQSRSGLLGVVAAMGVMLVLGLWPYRRLWLPASALLVVGGLTAFALAGEQAAGLVRSEMDRLLEVGDTDTQSSIDGRLQIWTRAVEGIGEFAYTGMGMGTFRRNIRELYPLFSDRPDDDIAHAHNHLLQAALDLGVPGLVAYLAVWLGAATMVASILSSRRPGMRPLAVGFGGSLAGAFVFGLTDAVALGARPGFVFWMLLGLVVAAFSLARSQPATH